MFFKRNGTLYSLIDKLIEQTKKTNDVRLKWKILFALLEIRWTKNYSQEAERINRALESKGEKIRKTWEEYKNDLLTLQREKKNTNFVEAKLEVLDKLIDGIE